MNTIQPRIADAFTIRTIRWGGALIVLAALINLANLHLVPRPSPLWNLADTLFDFTVGFAMLGLSYTGMFPRHWRPIAWVGCALIVVSDGALGAYHGENEMFFISVALMMVGTGSMLPWSVRWQACFNAFCVVVWALIRANWGTRDSDEAARWVGVLIAAAIAQAVTVMRERYARERQESEHKIRESENKLRKVFDVSSEMITITGFADGHFIDMNSAFEATGYSRSDAFASSDLELGIWPSSEERETFYNEIALRGRVENMEIGFRARNGAHLTCLVSATKVELQGKECIISAARNITAQKQVERELIEAREQALAASRAKSGFLSSMSHEIRTPLNAILGMAELLQESKLDQEQCRYLTTMVDNGNALLGLINDVLDLARVESGKISLEHTEFDLKDLVDRVVDTLGIRAREKELMLTARIEPGVPTLLIGDPLRLRQILVNLFGNATKFTECGAITLTVANDRTSPESGALLFSVTDTGIGIGAREIEQIFATFVQADSSTARKYGGSGLGLSIVRQLVELMGGRVWVESELERGSTFHFSARFGLQDASTTGAVAARIPSNGRDRTSQVSHVRSPSKPLRILLADDSADNRMLVAAYLKNTPYVIDQVENGAVAVEHFREQRYDLVLMDIQMPVMDGHAATRAIRSWERENDRVPTPIVAVSAAALSESFTRSRDAGCDEHVTKPIRKAALLEVIDRITA